MNEYRSLEISQKGVVQYFLGDGVPTFEQNSFPFKSPLPGYIDSGSCLLLWDDDHSLVPYAIAAERGLLYKLLPKLMSLPNAPFPVTSACRVWDFGEMQSMNARPPLIEVGRVEGFVALIVGELYCRIGAQLNLKTLGSSSARRTFSFFLVSLYLSRVGRDEYSRALDAWMNAAEITENVISTDLLHALDYLSEFLRFIPNGDVLDSRLLGEKIKDWLMGHVSDFDGVYLADRLLFTSEKFRKSSREVRYEEVMSLIEEIRTSKSPLPYPLRSLMTGYAISLIEPSSLDFLSLGIELEKISPGTVCAYMLCVSLVVGKSFLLRYGGLGVNIIQAATPSKRTGDISLIELELLSSGADFSFRTAAPSLLEVELIPHICGTFHTGQRRGESGTQGGERELNVKAPQILELNRIERGLEELHEALARLRVAIDPPESTHSQNPKRNFKRR